jgi:hypothetical protein
MDVQDLSRAAWRTSAHSGGNGSCVEIANLPGSRTGVPGAMAVRDSKDRQGPALIFSADEWTAFTLRIKTGQLDLP